MRAAKLKWIDAEIADYRLEAKTRGSRLVVDNCGRPGLGPLAIRPSELIAVCAGGTTLVALREVRGWVSTACSVLSSLRRYARCGLRESQFG